MTDKSLLKIIQDIRPDEVMYLDLGGEYMTDNLQPQACKHIKVSADFVYATIPPITPWICAVCGLKGEDRGSFPLGPSYQELVEKFRDR